ncbi:MAG: FTR1 family protein [Myxococcota bacterium]
MTKLGYIALAALTAGCVADSGTAEDTETKVRRVVALLDYVAGDYAGAVRDGSIVDDKEYEEQRGFMHDAVSRAAVLPAAPLAGEARRAIADAERLVEARARAEAVAGACRAARQQLLTAYSVTLAPSLPPSRDDGASLFVQRCVMCHGSRGGGDGLSAQGLKPPPRSFLDPAVMAHLSPVRAFSALSDGVPGTAMQPLPNLDERERWDLAFYVVSLRHDLSAAERGAHAAGMLPPMALARASLANATDADLATALEGAGVGPTQRDDALAYLRILAPYESGPSLDGVREALVHAKALYASGDRRGARDTASDAYLNGFEPLEGKLAVTAPELVHAVEEQFLALRSAADDGVASGQFGSTVDSLDALIEAADARLGEKTSGWSTALTVFVIIVREGVESVLLLMLLLGLTARAGGPGDRRSVQAGAFGALLLGVLTWFASAAVVGLGGANREMIEGIIALVAVLVLVYSGHFVLARMDAQRRIAALKHRFQSLDPRRRRWLVFSLAFAAVYREAFEVVLFLRAVALGSPASGLAFVLGLLAGIIACVGFAMIAARLGRRLKPSLVLALGGGLLCVLAIVLAGKGVRSLQEAGTIGVSALGLPRVDVLGFYPTLETLVAQLIVLGALVALTFMTLRRAPAPTS